MTDYQIEAHTRRCAVTGRELKPGERVWSVLIDDGGRFVRRDYSPEAWQGPPPGAFSFWASRVPSADGPRRPPIDDDMLFDCFRRLDGQTEPDRVQFRYVVALLLMRRKRLKFESARTEGEHEILVLRCPRSRTRHEVVHPRLTEEEMSAVQDEVYRVLGWA
ncbi:MAG: hypothetical protein NZ700_02045 [Gemmataceae bacterium]|nr:hypothetical protein [Gemmataceae bacterium]MDW8265399.1 hypothetical protein [Gemmataceae bacterium]